MAFSALPAAVAIWFRETKREWNMPASRSSAVDSRHQERRHRIQHRGSLSGGNQQKVVLARALLSQSSLVLAEEPTAGVDVGARMEIYRILRDVSNQGDPVVIVSSDGLELEGLCDRVLVFSRGHVVGELAGADVTEEKVGRLMVTATSHLPRRRQAEFA